MNEIAAGTILFILTVLCLSLVVLAARRFLLPQSKVNLLINDQDTLAVASGQKLLYALTGAGIPLPSACAGAGTCGLCKLVVKTGGGEVLPGEKSRLSRAEVRGNVRLACQVTIRSDLAVQVDEALLNAQTWECVVRSTRSLAPLIREIILDVPAGEKFSFRAGAFVQVTAPPYSLSFDSIELPDTHARLWERSGVRGLASSSPIEISRAYSIANASSDRDCIVLNIRLALPPPDLKDAPPGVVSAYLFGLRPGATVTVSGPYGDFAVRDTEREMVFIGGGVGMAPLRAMISDQLERAGSSRKISFWYGARSGDELFYVDEFERLQATHSNFQWTVALSEPKADEDWDGPTGFIHDVVARQYLTDHPAPEECEYYLCGPPFMIQAVVPMLEQLGVEHDCIFNDDFGG